MPSKVLLHGYLSGLICTLSYLWLAWLSHQPLGPHLWEFGTAVTIIFVVMIAFSLKSVPPLSLVLGFALLFRGIGFYGEPIYEDDYFRYLWDGFRFAMDGTPYGISPAAFFNDPSLPESFQGILDRINNPEIPTLYAPTFQYVFLVSYWIAPGELWPLKLILITADIALMLLLARLVPCRHLLWYAWNPLVIKEIAFTAHPDGLLGGLLLVSWFLIAHHRLLAASLALALAAGTKVAAWPVIPFMLLRCQWRGLITFGLGMVILYGPFWLGAGSDFQGLSSFARDFEFNSSLYALANIWLPGHWTRPMLALCYLGAVGFYFWRQLRNLGPSQNPIPFRADILLGGLLLISPVFNPWYLLWLLPWACLHPSFTAWTASASVLLTYVTGLNLDQPTLGAYQHPLWVRPVEFGLIGLALIWDLRRHFNKHFKKYLVPPLH